MERLALIYFLIGMLDRDSHVIIVNDPEAKLYHLLETLSPEEIYKRLSPTNNIIKLDKICSTYLDLIRSIHSRSNQVEIKTRISKIHENNLLYSDVRRRILANDWKVTELKREEAIKQLDLSSFGELDKKIIVKKFLEKGDNGEYVVSNNLIIDLSKADKKAVVKLLKNILTDKGLVLHECSICSEDFIDVTQLVVCLKCKVETCKTCMNEYIKNAGRLATCINPTCKLEFTNKFIIDQFGKKYFQDVYKGYIKQILFDREKLLIPMTLENAKMRQGYAPAMEERVRLKRELKKIFPRYSSVLIVGNQEITLRKIYLNDKNSDIAKIYKKNKTKIDNMIFKIKELNERIDKQYAAIYGGIRVFRPDGTPMKQERVQIYELPCPLGNCKGFIKKSDWSCVICESTICDKCHELKQGKHVCDPNAVLTATNIMKESRPCPTCAVRIYKTEGCDQMFCTMCHTAFSWTTGDIEKGRIHNPHYFELVRNKKEEATIQHGNIPCGELPDIHYYMRDSIHKYSLYINMFYRIVGEATDTRVLGQFGQITDTEKYRVRYINNEITEKAFLSKILSIDVQNEKNRNILLIFEAYSAMMIERFRELLHTIEIIDDNERYNAVEQILLEMYRITFISNLSLYNECEIYNATVCPHFNCTSIRIESGPPNNRNIVLAPGVLTVKLDFAKKQMEYIKDLKKLPKFKEGDVITKLR